MIAYLKGKILTKTPKGIILDTGNIGYFVHLSKPALENSLEHGEFFIHTHVKEDSLDLYGFLTKQDHDFFELLITINGIGPKVGLEILSQNSEKVKNAILNEDEAFIRKIPGIGPKTAKRLILELKDKVVPENLEAYTKVDTEAHNDVIEALTRLGYQKHDITRRIKDLPQEVVGIEEIITYFLKNS